tara:strand:- start:998 stop:1705 length:708 start_codon:yes stop_codon:yes gene_type:complete
MEKKAIQRIINRDIKEIQKLNLNSLGIYIQFNEDNFLEAKAMIVGPKDSLYEGGFLLFNIYFPKNYPFAPPDVVYVSRNRIRIHPNIYVGHGTNGFGKVCLSILGTWSGPKWTTIMDITTVLLTIQSLLDNNPLHHEPGQEKNVSQMNQLYNEVIEYDTMNTLIIKNITDTPKGFEIFLDDMKNELKTNYDNIQKKLLEKKDNDKKTINVHFYRINEVIDYHGLSKKYDKLLKII